MRILVTGGSGLVGRTLLAHLVRTGHETVALFRRAADVPAGVTVEQTDIRDSTMVDTAFDRHRPDVIIHLAALLQFACEDDPGLAVDVNVNGTVNLLEAARIHGVSRFVFGSSVAAYGRRDTPMREDDPPTADMSVYGETKRLGEIVGNRYAALHGSEFIALRYAGIFGPGAAASPGMALARHLIKSSANGEAVEVENVSGDETGHLTYLEDAVRATLLVALHGSPLPHALYNVAGPDANFVTLKQFHEAVRRVVPTAGEARFTGPGARGMGPVDTTRLRQDLGYDPAYAIDDGLRDELGLA